MKLNTLFLGPALMLSLMGCGKNDPAAASANTATSSDTYGGMSYPDYYNQFLFSAEKCSADKSRYYHFAASDGFSQLKTSNQYFYIDLYLHADSSYEAALEIMVPTERPGTMRIVDTLHQNGRWAVQGQNLVLENLGVGHAFTYNNYKAIDLYLDNVAASNTFNKTNTILVRKESLNVPVELEVECK